MPKSSHNTEGILQVLAQHANAHGHLSYYDFVNTALYDPQWGYYQQPRQRVGQSAETDFYTASSLGPVFGRLVLEAAHTLWNAPTADIPFIEIGAEPGAPVFDGLKSPFSEHVCHRLGETKELPSPAVIFANEVLDAQPFHRFIFQNGRWQELGILIDNEKLTEIILPEMTSGAQFYQERLPQMSTPGYIIDVPSGAEFFLTSLIPETWEGMIILADYGKTAPALLYETPQGSARAYAQHKQKQDLLANPGKQDLTCHIIWDWIEQCLLSMGFTGLELNSQEAFFMKNSQSTIKEIITKQEPQLSNEKNDLQALLHPAHFGQKFQILSARRTSIDI